MVVGGNIERCVLGALIIDPNGIGGISDRVAPEMFQDELLGRLYVGILRAYNENRVVDAAILVKELTGAGYPADIAGAEIAACVSEAVTSVHLPHYVMLFLDDYKARRVGNLINGLVPRSDIINQQIGELMTDLEGLIAGEQADMESLEDIVNLNASRYFCEREDDGIYTGFQGLDDMLGGLEGGDMIVIGARPGVGKSALVTQIVTNMAKAGRRVGFFNLEMQTKQVYERFIVNRSGISLNRLRFAKAYLGDERERFAEANNFLRSQNIRISTGSKKVGRIRALCKHMDFDVIVVDYLQLVRADSKCANRYNEVGEVSRGLKALAMELNVPVIALSQLNRVSETKETKEPTMGELREAGNIEQDASIIVLLWNLTEERDVKGVKVDKNRQGITGKIALAFDGQYMRFQETEYVEEEDERPQKKNRWRDINEDDIPFD